MGFLQASNGIDSKANVLVTGSVFVRTNISASGNITGSNLFASNTISGSNISASGDIVAGDDVYVKGMGSTTTDYERIVAISPSTGQLLYVNTSSLQVPPITTYQVTSGAAPVTASINAATAKSLNGGYILANPSGQSSLSGGMIKIDFSTVVTDYATEIISYGNGDQTERLNLEITLPSVGGGAGWTGHIMGYVDNNTQTYGEIWITNGNAGGTYDTLSAVGVTRRLDSSSRTVIVINLANRRLYVHSTNLAT
jgi:hypothetical protein